jgi:apolipoprotein N-acyltransferase
VSTKTIYSQLGDWFGYLIVLTAVVFILLRPKRKNIPKPEN